MPAPLADVLIYHHGADAASADWISAALIREGYTVKAEEWPARGNLAHSENARILFVVLLSERLYAEPGFLEALRELQDSSAQLFPVLIENFHVGGGGQLDRINYLRLFELDQDAAEQMLLHAVRAVGCGDVLGELPGNTPTVFISYSFEDAEAASRIERHLRDGGYRTFRATDFLVGSEWVNRLTMRSPGSGSSSFCSLPRISSRSGAMTSSRTATRRSMCSCRLPTPSWTMIGVAA
jgi:hypothetical protein